VPSMARARRNAACASEGGMILGGGHREPSNAASALAAIGKKGRQMKRSLVLRFGFLVLSTAVAGCYVTAEPVAPASDGEVVAEAPPPPPPPPPEPIPPSPGPGNVWIAGYHRWDGHKYNWERGHYERPPRENSHFEQGHWEQRGKGKVWVDGHWG
jgi:WXXGXW repeat (2 copies)